MQGKLYDARQLFVFESETGIRISDILKLRWQNYDGHYIQIIMDKTDRQLKIPASDLVKEICAMRERRYKTAGVPITPDGFIFRGILPYEYRQHVKGGKSLCGKLRRGANQSCIEKSCRFSACQEKPFDARRKTYLCVAFGSFRAEYGCNSGFTRPCQYSHDGNLCEDHAVADE